MSLVDESLIADDRRAINELKSKLDTYHDQKSQVDELLATDPDNAQVATLVTQISEAIKVTRDMIDQRWKQLKEKEEEKYVVEAVCEAKYDREGWYTCKVEEVVLPADEDDDKKWLVSFFGFPGQPLHECTLHQLRPFKPPPADKLVPGSVCKAVWKGQYCEAVIDTVTAKNTCWVTFKGYQTSEEVPLYLIRLHHQKDMKLKRPALMENAAALAAKKKQKVEKQKQRAEDREKEMEGAKQGWQNFAGKMARSKKLGGLFHTKGKESLFRSPESLDGKVGVMWSDKGMTEGSKFKPLSKGEKQAQG